MKEKPNLELAGQYFNIATNSYASIVDFRTASSIKKKLEVSNIDLRKFYEQNGSFEDLKIKRIGTKVKKDLELILEKGYETALRITREKRDLKLQEKIESDRWKYRIKKAQLRPRNILRG